MVIGTIVLTPATKENTIQEQPFLPRYKLLNGVHLCTIRGLGGRLENIQEMGSMKEVGTSQTDASHSLHLLSIISF